MPRSRCSAPDFLQRRTLRCGAFRMRETLRAALAELRAGGVEDILLIAGDAPRPIGEFSGTLDVLESRILEESGIARIGVAGHPEGHNAVATPMLWEALEAKQAFAARAAVSMHIVTQFGLNGSAFKPWARELARRRIHPARAHRNCRSRAHGKAGAFRDSVRHRRIDARLDAQSESALHIRRAWRPARINTCWVF